MVARSTSRRVRIREKTGQAASREYEDRLVTLRAARVVVSCDGIIDIAAALFNVSGRELRDPRRSSLGVSRVRQIAMYVAHVVLGISMREVGFGFGRDRTTVLHACHQVEDMRDDAEFDGMVAMTERVVRAAFACKEQ